MKLFNFFMIRENNFSDEDVEKEYQKAMKRVQKVDSERCRSLVCDMKRYAERTCVFQKGDDLLEKKAEFMRIYAFRAYQWRCYHTLGYKKGQFNSSSLWTQKWHDYEQGERLKAQKRWREMLVKTR